MSQITTAATEVASADDPFYYGWRYVSRVQREFGEEWRIVTRRQAERQTRRLLPEVLRVSCFVSPGLE